MRFTSSIRAVGALLVLAQLPTSLFGMGEVVLCRSAIGHVEIEVKHVNPCQEARVTLGCDESDGVTRGHHLFDEHCVDEPIGLDVMVNPKNRSIPVMGPMVVLYWMTAPPPKASPRWTAPVYVSSPDSIESLVQNVTLLI